MADKMKKQFFRVRELANQSLFRGEKNEVLTESLQLAERRVDALQKACSVSARKIISCLAGHGTDAMTVEKRSKKIPEIVLGNAMLESSTPFGEASVLGRMLHEVGSLENELGYELLQYELKVEQIIAAHLQQVEGEVASVVKNRRNLNKLTVEMDASRKVYQSNRVSVGNSKNDQLREEMEDAYQKVELSRDILATEIYTLIAREPEFAETILQYAQLKRDYHRAALQLLETNIPKLESIISENPNRPAFGTKLEVHLESSGRTIAYPIEVCVCALLEVGLEEEGLFRVAGGSSKVRKLKAAFDAGYAELGAVVEDCRDPHAITSVLKSYLRELPEPILPHELYDDWIAAVRVGDLEGRLQAMKQVLGKMPENRLANLRYLVRFLAELVKYQESNKMTPSNLAIVIAPNLIWSPAEDNKSALGMNMSLANTYSLIVEHLIGNCEFFFPGSGDMDFYVTCSKLVVDQPSPKTDSRGSRVSAPECPQEVQSPLSRTHRRIDSFDRLLSFANGSETGPPSSPKLPVRRKNKPAPVPPTPSKTEEPPSPSPEQKNEAEKARPPLPPPPSERTATLPRQKEMKAKKAELEKIRSKEDLLAEIDREVNRKLEEEEAQKVQSAEEKKEITAEEDTEVRRREGNLLSRAASIRNRVAVFERPSEDTRMSKSVGNLTGEGTDASVVQKRLNFLEGQQVAPIRVPVPAERSKLPGVTPPSSSPAVSETRKSLEKYMTTVEVEKSKPIIPERPVALPRLERKNSVSAEQGKAVLEKTHVYSVDKQQASIVQVHPHDTLSRKCSSSSFSNLDLNKGSSSPLQDRQSIEKPLERYSFQDSPISKRHSVTDVSINGKMTGFEKIIQAFEFADSDTAEKKELEGEKGKVETVKKGEKSGESSDSDVEVRKKPAKPPKPERPMTRPAGSNRSSNEIDANATNSALDKEGKSVTGEDFKVPVAVPRPNSHPISKPRGGSGESTDF